MARSRYLSIYVNDHLAALMALRAVAGRCLRSNRETPLGRYLAGLVRELDESADELTRIAQDLGIRRDPFKRFAAWAAEKGGRLKLNGHLVKYSPLSRVVELEGLLIGAELELHTWRALAGATGRDLSALEDRCERRRAALAGHHAAAVEAALGREGSSQTR